MNLSSLTTPDTAENGQPAVATLLERMTLAEKIGQMTQIEKNSITPAAVSQYAIGSVLSGGGGNPSPNNPQNWAAMVRTFQEAALESRLGIPLLYGVDAVHGHNNVYGATIFPHNVALGATRNADLVEAVGWATARELLATNVHWNFAPCVAVPQDIRWGRTYEGFGEDPDLVSALGAAYVRGMQNHAGAPALTHAHTALACAKHYIADGGTSWGTTGRYPWIEWGWHSDDDRWSIDQGVSEIDEATLRAVHLPPYEAAIAAGALSIMVSYSSWGGQKLHAHHYLLTEILKGKLGFKGFLVTDWMAINQIDPDYYTAVVMSINAGLDMVMVPFNYEEFIDVMTRAVEQGDIAETRIDDAVSRILMAKAALGLFDHPYGDETLLAEVRGEEHKAIARRAVQQSLVLLKNEDSLLPLSAELPALLVAGAAADDVGLQCGGWTIEWSGAAGPVTPGTTLLDGLRARMASTQIEYDAGGRFAGEERAPVGLVVLAEQPYAEGEGDRADLSLPASAHELVRRMRARCDRLIVILYSGRPLLINNEIKMADAFVAAWLPGSEGEGIADVLLGEVPFRGRLPYSWPRDMAQIAGQDGTPLFPYGFGL